VTTLSKQLWDSLSAELSHININGHKEKRYPGNLNISFECVEGESLLMGMNEVAVSSGSACTSASLEPSYVLRAIGVDAETAHTSIRFGLGRFTTEAEVAHTAEKCIYEVKRLREMSPLWHMKMDGGEINWRK
jgi:cysteine desulfurase